MHKTKPKLIQLIHIAKQKLAMDEFSYRAMLERVTGKTSCKEMSVAELMKVEAEMEAKGFKKTSRRNHSPSRKSAFVKSNIAHKIRAIWIEMSKKGLVRDGSETALNAWVRGVVNPIYQKRDQNIQILNVGALRDDMASLVLERLKKWQARGNV